MLDDSPIEMTDVELENERRVLARIQQVHRDHLERARTAAARLAEDAARGTEDGIRDLVDEDGEVDAAIRAALVRQSADHAMHAFRRSQELASMGEALAFGYTVGADGTRLDVGRLTVIDDGEPILIDWRAPAAVPFYRATPLDRLGVIRRRHLLYRRTRAGPSDPRATVVAEDLVGYSDEVFDVDDLVGRAGLRGEAAILAALDAPTQAHMRSVVATIQAEQDAVVRAPSSGALVVQGGPGTGKTVVALHRAAYLLYDQRAALADTGVLIVGPSSEFLAYISDVLPSLGESGVISVTAPELFPGILRGGSESQATAAVKGTTVMAEVLAAAVRDRQRPPVEPFETWYGSRRVVLDVPILRGIFERAQRHAHHNDGAAAFRQGLIEALALMVYDPSFGTLADAADAFGNSRRLRHFTLRHWPTLTAEQALNDLFGSRALLRSAARGLPIDDSDRALLHRARVPEADGVAIRWTDADVPLLDELLELLGPVVREHDEEQTRRDALDEFELAQRFEAQVEPIDDDDFDLGDENFDPEDAQGLDPDGLEAGGLSSLEQLASEEDDGFDDTDAVTELDLDAADALLERRASIAELAARQRTWRFGHVIVDEAQDLTPMQWRMIVRRAGNDSMTIVGDLAQRSIGAPGTWREHLPDSIDEFAFRELTVNYRSPAEVGAVAARILGRLAPELSNATPIRHVGVEPRSLCRSDVVASLDEVVAEERRLLGSGKIGVISVDPRLVDANSSGRADVHVLTPRQAKGLEFDAVIVVEPAAILDQDHGLSLLYVAVTRTTKRLAFLHARPLPEVIAEDCILVGSAP